MKILRKRISKKNQEVLRVGKVIKKKNDKLYVKCKGHNNYSNIWIDRKHILEMALYFPELKLLRGNVKFKLNLTNYATKADFKKRNRC